METFDTLLQQLLEGCEEEKDSLREQNEKLKIQIQNLDKSRNQLLLDLELQRDRRDGTPL